MRKSLIIVPHPDDEVLSFAGYIITELRKGNDVRVIIMACGGPSSKESKLVRKTEFNEVMDFLGVDKNMRKIAAEGMDGSLDTYPSCKLTGWIDEQIDQYQPDNILSCYPSTHSDHIAVYKAFQGSMRLKEGHLPNLVALGEYPFILPSLETPMGGKMYLPMSEDTFNMKCEAFKLYKSQNKKSPSPLGVDGIRILAETRGLECGNKYAEMYYIQKLVKHIC